MLLFGVLLVSCHSGGGNGTAVDDTPGKGTIRISVDESFKPIIDSQIKVYMASNPEANIIAEYKPEAECLRDLQNDSTRMVIVTRGLSKGENEGFEAKLGFKPSWGLLAYDAVAVLLHQQSKDSVFTMSELRAMLLDQSPKSYQIVMDGNKATSTVRFAIDSLLKGQPLGRQVVAAKSSPDVIDYVSRTPGSLGMVGVSWIGNPDDSLQLTFMKKVQVAALQCDGCPGKPFTRPYQANIAMGRYPLIRGLYFILKENYNGLGRGFVNFLIYERGQLIFKRAYLLPGRMNFEVRNMRITE
jgi:phosphate transport system substrate-binding protein